MVQDIRTGKNTTAAAGTDTNGDQWLDVLPDPLTSDSLKKVLKRIRNKS
jgi:hypothetical protein